MSETPRAIPPFPPTATAVARKRKQNFDFQQCLKQYATAALGTAGVSAVALAQNPSHHIQYTPANISLTAPPGSVVPIDFNHDGITDISMSAYGFTQAFSGHGGSVNGNLYVIPAVGNLANGAHAFAFGVPLDNFGTFRSSKQRMAYAREVVLATSSYHKTTSGGPFKNVTNKYLGVKIKIGGQMHEGWVRISLTCNHGTVSATITGYAYDIVANEKISAGRLLFPASEKSESQEAMPASLGILAAGSAAIPYWRK